MAWHVLDTSVLLQGADRPPGEAATTPEAAAEVRPGGRDARRFEAWLAAGLQVRTAGGPAVDRVREAARQAGSLGRLSVADVSVLALALELEGLLWTDDNTVLDVAARLGVRARPVREGGIEALLEWAPRCSGCGRWLASEAPCPVCGSPVHLRPSPGSPGGPS